MSRERFLSILRTFDSAMLITRQDETSLRARPMAIAESTDKGRLWFLTKAGSGKLDELAQHPRVNVALQDDRRYLSISGTARGVRDQRRAEELWTETQRIWFPEGPHDPTLMLIEVVPHHAEYWDRSGVEGLKFMLAEAEAIICGEAVDEHEAGAHDEIGFE